MNYLLYSLLFFFGSAIGSFLNVLTIRYQPDKPLLSRDIISGRSLCPFCHKILRWYELIPLISFVIQKGRCRACHQRLSWQYPIVEFITGALFILVFWRLFSIYHPLHTLIFAESLLSFYISVIVWLIVLVIYLAISIIDLKHQIIPDGLNIILFLAALILIVGGFKTTFLGSYNALFGVRDNIWLNHLIASLVALLFFLAIYFLWEKRGIGLGDIKLAAVSGFLLGWPDIALASILAFTIGALVSIFLMLYKKRTIKDFIPFGPFLALGVFLVFFFGESILRFYFNFIELLT